MAKAKAKATEEIIVEDAIIDTPVEEIIVENVQEVTLNIPAFEVESPGHHSRDLKDILK